MSSDLGRDDAVSWSVCDPSQDPTRVAMTNAERQRSYRKRRAAMGLPLYRGKTSPAPKKTMTENASFIVLDGEGEDYGDEEERDLSDGSGKQRGRAHRYTLLAAFDGQEYEELYKDGERLRAADILDWLTSLRVSNPRGIFCGFALGYDWNHWFLFDLSREETKLISAGQPVMIMSEGCFYEVRCRMRKSLEIRRFSGTKVEWKQTKTGKWSPSNRTHIFTVWDVWGFFQGSFVSATKTWLGDHPDLAYLARMKAERGNFANVMHDEIAAYNRVELRVLFALMLKLRTALNALRISINRWDGAGAIAAAMNRLKRTRDHMSDQESPAFTAARHAYSGGHIEAIQIGVHRGPVYHYDLNSAYPAQYCHLPNLKHGRWHHSNDEGRTCDEVPYGFTCVRVVFSFCAKHPFYPLFYREKDGSIRYPREGHGWYWFPEFDTARSFALRHDGSDFRILEWYHFEPFPSAIQELGNIFRWVQDYYSERQSYVSDIKAKRLTAEDQWKTGAEKTIKLGLNSLYGKTAQQVGGKEGKPPAYFCLEWAGYITSATRAALMKAALKDPTAMIAFATDGIYSTRSLPLDCPSDKILGAWEFTEHDGMTIVMSGVYWQFDAGKWKGFSRGFEKDVMNNPDLIIEAWKQGKLSIGVPSRRLIGLGSAHLSDGAWAFRGRFVSSERELCLTGANSKRHPYNRNRKAAPWQALQRTSPRDAIEHTLYGENAISAPYPIRWINDGANSEHDGTDGLDLMTEAEARDFDNHFNLEMDFAL